MFLLSFSASIYLYDHRFDTSAGISTTTQWIHLVLNFIGPENGQGIEFYRDGMLAGSDDAKEVTIHPPGSPFLRRHRK